MFCCLQSHLKMAHAYWEAIIKPQDVVIDATAGNGHDTLFMAKLAKEGCVYAFDIQVEALEKTRIRLKNNLSEQQFLRIKLIQGCHSQFPEEIRPKSVKLIAYNLGYLPGGNKNNTTLTKTTLKSIENGLALIQVQGVISITCYPGHPEGKIEESAILDFASQLDRSQWNCSHHRWINRKNSPSLLFISRQG